MTSAWRWRELLQSLARDGLALLPPNLCSCAKHAAATGGGRTTSLASLRRFCAIAARGELELSPAWSTQAQTIKPKDTLDTEHQLIVTHEVTNSGSDRAQLANIASQAKAVLGVDELEAVADRGYFSGEEILACDEAGIAVTLPKPMTSGIEARGLFGKQDFVYLSDEDVYRCPAGEKLKYHYTNEELLLFSQRSSSGTVLHFTLS